MGYEGEAKNKYLAKAICTKNALRSLKLIKVDQEHTKDEQAIDTKLHPLIVLYKMFGSVNFKGMRADVNEFYMEATIDGKIFSAKGRTMEKAKLKLVLAIFEQLKSIPPNAWECMNLSDILD